MIHEKYKNAMSQLVMLAYKNEHEWNKKKEFSLRLKCNSKTCDEITLAHLFSGDRPMIAFPPH